MNEVGRVGAFIVSIFASFCEACNFFGASLFLENFIFSFEKLMIFFEFYGFRIKNGIDIV